jgi:Protein of unknown function (DUF1569)
MRHSPARRQLIAAAPTAPVLSACGSAPVEGLASISLALKAIESLDSAWRSAGAWTLPQTLAHLAQSIEYSMSGFPKPNSALFQSTLGRAAWTVFDALGRMRRSLSEPIPGAPALELTLTLEQGRERLLQALVRFDAHTGPMQPHFAYGLLDKGAYARAHLMHVSNHRTEWVRS